MGGGEKLFDFRLDDVPYEGGGGGGDGPGLGSLLVLSFCIKKPNQYMLLIRCSNTSPGSSHFPIVLDSRS